MGGGAWPFLVGVVKCLVDSVNERDLNLLNSYANCLIWGEAASAPCLRALPIAVNPLIGSWLHFLEGLIVSSDWKFEAKTGL